MVLFLFQSYLIYKTCEEEQSQLFLCCSFFLPDATRFFYHFLSVWSASFSQSLRVGLKQLILLVFLCLRMSLFFLHSWRIVSLTIEFTVDVPFLSTLKNVSLLPGLHDLIREVPHYSNWLVPIHNPPFLSSCSQDFLSSLVRSLIWILYIVLLFLFLLFGVHSASWIYKFVSFAEFGEFWAISSSTP